MRHREPSYYVERARFCYANQDTNYCYCLTKGPQALRNSLTPRHISHKILHIQVTSWFGLSYPLKVTTAEPLLSLELVTHWYILPSSL